MFQRQASGERPRLLVVLCHGFGGDATQLMHLAHAWAAAIPEAAFAAPHAPFHHRSGWRRLLYPKGRKWFDLASAQPGAEVCGVRRGAECLNGFVDAELARLDLPDDAYALVGFSQGAMIALFAGLRRPAPPLALLAYAGALLLPETLHCEICNRPPVLLVHGERDSIVPPDATRQAEKALGDLGVPVEAVFRPQLGHAIDEFGAAAGADLLRRTEAGRREAHSLDRVGLSTTLTDLDRGR